MKFLKITLILSTFFLIGCNDKTSNEKTNKESDLSNVFVFSVEFIAKKTDNFALFYTEDGTANFGEKVIWKQANGSETTQNIEFYLPKDIYPTQFRLDLGSSQEQSEVILKSISFKFNNKKRVIKGLEMGAFFRSDDTKCSFDYKTGIVKTVTKDGKNQGFSLYPHESVQMSELPKLLK
jgi:hypothetical protein